MDHLRQYASFLLAGHLDALASENISQLQQHQVPILSRFQHLSTDEIRVSARKSLQDFLESFIQGKAMENAWAMLQRWKDDQLPGISRDQVGMDDLIFTHSIRKQLLLQYLPRFTQDFTIFLRITHQLEEFYRAWQQEALQMYFTIQQEELARQNEALRERIAAMQETKAALKESQAMAHLGNWTLDAVTGKVTWSDELYRIFGQEPAPGQNVHFTAQFIHPEDWPVLQQKLQECIRENIAYSMEYRITRPDGATRTLLSSGYPVTDPNGKVIKLKGITQDITERKDIETTLTRQQEELQTVNEELLSQQEELQATNEELREQVELRMAIEEDLRESEQKYRLLADHASDLISTHTPEGVFTYVSPSCRTLLGYTEEELIGRQVYEFFHPEDIAHIQERHLNSFKVPDTQHTIYRIRIKSGEYIWIESLGRSIRDPQTGQVIALQVTSRDITLRKQVEENLERERKYLQAILEHITDGIVACDAQGMLSFFNKATRQFHGLPEQAIPADQWANHYNLYYADGVTPMQTEDIPLFRAYRGEKVENAEMVIAPAHGQKRLLLANGNQVWSGSGRLLGAVVVMHDITEQRSAEQEMLRLNHKLQERNEELTRTEELLTELNTGLEAKVLERAAELEASLQQFRFLTDSVPQIIWTASAGGSVTYFNQNWYNYTGLAVEESMQWGWQMIIHPEDLERCLQRWIQSVNTGSLYEIEYRLRRGADGFYRWHLERGVPMRNSDGTIIQWFGSCTDIHDHKLAGEELRTKNRTLELLNGIGTALSAELDLQKIVQSVTDAATEVTGAEFGAFFYNLINEKGESYTLYTISGVPREAFSRFPMPRNTAVFAPTFHGEGIIRSDDITQDERYGKNAPYHGMPAGHLPVRSYLAIPVTSREGKVIGGLFFGHSQTGVFTAEAEEIVKGIASQAAVAVDNATLFEALREKNRELTRINADLDSFMYTASHDLKAPIANLSSLFSLLNRRFKDKIEERDQPLFEMINHSIAQFNRTLRDLTEVVAVQKETEPASQVSFREVLESIQTDTGQMLAESGGEIRTDFAVESMTIEKKNLRSILYNLISNSIKYRSPERQLTVQVNTYIQHDWVVLEIRDNGLGLNQSQQSKLFTLFKRLHNHVEGSGVGLYIVKRIVENKGGRIEVESEEGKGTTFRVFLRK